MVDAVAAVPESPSPRSLRAARPRYYQARIELSLEMNTQEFIYSHPKLVALVFSTGFVCMWCLVVAIVSFVGGWFQLSRTFSLNRPFDGVSDGLQSGQMRWFAKYRSCLRLGANAEGLYLAVFFLFRFMHPPLFVPWTEIKVHRQKGWLFGECVTFTMGNDLRIPLRVSGTSARMLEDGAGTHWPQEI